jgi:DNA adenine methylase
VGVGFSGVLSPCIWFGGKGKLAREIIRRMPNHKTYVEPFLGGANVVAQKEEAGIEIVNDIDEDLVNFLMVNREEPARLAADLETLPYSRSLYDRWKWEEKPEDPFERAVRWFYINRSAVAAGNNHKSGWRHGKSVNPAVDYHSAIGRLEAFAKRMSRVQIECRDFREIIKTYDSPDTFFYIDPPYVGNERRYKGGFTEQDHIDLADILEAIEGKAMVSYYDGELIDRLYGEWQRYEIPTHQFSQVRKEEERPERTELLLMNWDDPQVTLFDVMEA